MTILCGELEPSGWSSCTSLVPTATTIGALVNPTNPNAEVKRNGLQPAAARDGAQVLVLNASNDAISMPPSRRWSELKAGGLLVANDGFFISRGEQLVALAARHAIPAITSCASSPRPAA